MSRSRFVELRRTALQELQTHHLSGNVEIDVSAGSGEVRVSMAIYRRGTNGEMLNTHCLYLLAVERVEDRWLIGLIVQNVLGSKGTRGIHKGIVGS